MGHLSPFDMLIAIGAFELALKQIGAKINLGAGVAAVQARIARSN
jgi:aspartate aminotransferase-like enzyme